MKAEDLRSLQAPFKERYRNDPQAASITLRAQGRLGEGLSCKVETGKALAVAGLHPATGVSKEARVGFERLRLQFALDTDATEEQVATLLRLTERYCVVYQTLMNPPPVAVSKTVRRSQG